MSAASVRRGAPATMNQQGKRLARADQADAAPCQLGRRQGAVRLQHRNQHLDVAVEHFLVHRTLLFAWPLTFS